MDANFTFDLILIYGVRQPLQSNLLHRSLLIPDHFYFHNVLFDFVNYFLPEFIRPSFTNYFMECFRQNITNLLLDNNRYPFVHRFLICFFELFVLNVRLESEVV